MTYAFDKKKVEICKANEMSSEIRIVQELLTNSDLKIRWLQQVYVTRDAGVGKGADFAHHITTGPPDFWTMQLW